MQLVGKDCAVCGNRIVFAPDASGCAKCAIVFHLACLTTSGICPRCGGDFAGMAEADSCKRSATEEGAIAWGRNAFITSCVVLIGVQVLALGLDLWRGTAPAGGGAMIVFLGCVVAALMGQDWARVVLGLSAAFGALAAGALAWNDG